MNLYKITNKNGAFLCYQQGLDENQAIESAKLYGFSNGLKKAVYAEYVGATSK